MRKESFSLRNRFMLIITVFFSAYLILAVYTDKAARDTVNNSQLLSSDMQELSVNISALSDTLHLLGIAMYQSTLYDSDDPPQTIQTRLGQLTGQINRLLTLKAVKQHNEFYEPAVELSESMSILTIHAQELLILQNDTEKKYPAIPIVLGKLQPINQEIIALIASAVDETKLEVATDSAKEPVLSKLLELRYIWSQVISSVRVFVANRLGAFGPPLETMTDIEKDKRLYTETLLDLFEQLNSLEQQDLLGFVQKDALQQIQLLHKEYEIYFKQAAKIYYSARWRADRTLLKEEVDPALDVAWGQVYLIQNRISNYSQAGISRFARTADDLSNYIWLAAIVSIFLMSLGYLVFEQFIRKPLVSVSLALEAAGKGEETVPQLDYKIKETDTLVSAFSTMQTRVRSRQLRLSSILDNAGEGILTINVFGKIENYNQAAHNLFGYMEEEVIDKEISMLIPSYKGIVTQHQLSQLVTENNANTNSVKREQELLGQRKDGRRFPLSIRLGQVNIEGEILYTALLSDISERKAMIDRLTMLAERDSLTGLYNRHFLMDELERTVDRALRGEMHSVALLYIDLDNFKFVNDTLGHLAGDTVLQDVTQILERRARGTDLVTRLGGDEFAIMLYDVDLDQAHFAADAYRRQLAEYIFRYKEHVVDIGCSIGVALLNEKIQNKEDLLSKADLACHIAKRGGRNRVHVYEVKDQESVDLMSADMGWSRRIKLALENDDFILDSQPIIDIYTGKTLSNELLIRLKEKNQITVMPDGFLPSADRFGLAIELDRWVINHGFELMSNFDAKSFPGFSINLSAKTIGDVSSLAYIKQKLLHYRIDPQKIIFEVTETSTIRNLSVANRFLSSLHELGFNTALDDFGAGYSSFTYINDLPVDYVKLDGSFVRDISHDKVKKAIVIAMNDVAHALGKKTVAEFVESRATLDVLREIGIDFCQGYYTGKPNAINATSAKVVYLHS